MLDELYFHDPRLTLVPLEHLSPNGVDPAFAARLARRPGWSEGRAALLGRGLALYWRRMEDLARRSGYLPPPRLRNVAVVHEADAVRPYASLLNESTWTTYDDDLDPDRSHPELVAYLLAHADRMAQTREVTLVAVHLAPWWFERSDEERAAFARAAAAATRPDADAYRAIAEALPWLRALRHERLRRPRERRGYRPIPDTGLLVPRASEHLPEQLVARCREVATATLSAFRTRWRGPNEGAARALCERLAADAPPLLVTGRARVLWDPDAPERVAELERELAVAGRAVVEEIGLDLQVVAERSRAFLAALRDPASLPPPDSHAAQSGYAYMHRTRGLVAYDLHEPGIERLEGPPLPYARAMLAARTVHEWAHRAVDGGFVPRTVDDGTWAQLVERLARLLDEAIAGAPRALRERCAADLRVLAREGSPGAALAAIFLTRLPDYQANLLGWRFLTRVERETYVRHNVRPLGREYPPERFWRMLVRYLYEMQYLELSEVADGRAYFRAATGCDRELLESGALTEERLAALADAAQALCAAHAVDESRLLSA